MVKNEIKGLVMEIEKKRCIIMTHDGEFRRVNKPPGQVTVGQEITVRTSTWSDWVRPLALVASLLLMVVAGWSVYQWYLPTAVAYVSLDINPSIELGVDSRSRVVEENGLNEDGRKLLRLKPVKGQDIYTAMSELVAAAVEQQYITEQKENLVFTAIELEPKAPAQVVEEQQVYQAINKSLTKVKKPVSVEVTEAEPEARQEAHKLGVSTGRYLLIIDAVKEDKNVQPKDLVKKSLAELKVKQWIEKKQQQKESISEKKSKPNKNVQDNRQIRDPRAWFEQWKAKLQERRNNNQQKSEQENRDDRDDQEKIDKETKTINNGRPQEKPKGSDTRYPGRNNNKPDRDDDSDKKEDRRDRDDD